MSTFFILLSVLLVPLLFVRLAKGRAQLIKAPEDLRKQLRAVDIDAFRNLVDPAEDEFLHAHLSRSEYRKVRRDRLRAILAYVSCVANNAAVLMRMGEAASTSPEATVAEAGKKLVDNALHLRMQTFQVKTKIYIQMVYPGASTLHGDLVGQYEQMTRQGVLLGRLQYPARGISGVF
jgi:hypothetical protein